MGALSPQKFSSHNGDVWREGSKVGRPLPCQILLKKSLKWIGSLGQIFTTKFHIFTILADLSTFLKLQWKKLARGGTWDSYPTPKFLKITQGDSSLMGKFLQNNQFFLRF